MSQRDQVQKRSKRIKAEMEESRPSHAGAYRIAGVVLALAVVAFLIYMGVRVYQRAVALAQRNPVVAAFSQDGQWLAVSVGQGTYLYDSTFQQKLNLANAKGGSDYGMSFSPDGKTLALNNTLWSTADGSKLRTLDVFDAFKLAYTADGAHLATFSLVGIDVWNVQDGSRAFHIKAGSGCSCQSGVTFAPDGKIVSFENNKTFFWNGSDGTQLSTWKRTGTLNSAALSKDGSLLAIGSFSTIEIWDTAKGQQTQTLKDNPGTVSLLAFTNDGKQVAGGITNLKATDSVVVWDTQNGQKVQTFPLKGRVASLSFSKDGTRIAVGQYNGTVTVWDVKSKQVVKLIDFTDWMGLIKTALQ